MMTYPFLPSDMSGLYNRVLKAKPSDIGASSAELRGRASLSAEAKRRRILEEAKSAVLERIRHPR